MFEKLFFIILIIWSIFLLFLDCDTAARTTHNCDCEYCDCEQGREEKERYDDPGEYEGYRIDYY